ncbi:hypothetical protein Pint_30416 [Pistacia integerrima]|uniref:Uncharacterized protein n=1 Tax=Pistacia integerrima TaxID=434235 RepID=A0ACC0X2E6_9ROSI|nr:hypothetical protein Pint_30416 [Pistacia integerrima]
MVKPSATETSPSSSSSHSVSPLQTFLVHLICGVGLGVGYWVAHNIYSINLVSHPSGTLRLIWVLLLRAQLLFFFTAIFGKIPTNPRISKLWYEALLGLPCELGLEKHYLVTTLGALLNALGAIALGAPVGIQYMTNTFDYSLLMSLFTNFIVFFLNLMKLNKRMPNGSVDYMICLPAHGAVIGAWFGAWPMPLDWERPWQEWPICVSYGAMVGYLIGMVASFGFVLIRGRQQHQKGD